jgi:antitoxin VapB
MTDTVAKLFINGGSQAVRLPKAFRFEGASEVLLQRDGERVIMTPRKLAPIERLLNVIGKFEDFPVREQPPVSDKRGSF